MMRLFISLFVCGCVVTGARPARADVITLTVGGDTFAAVADNVTLLARTFTLDLSPHVPVTALLQTGAFAVGNSGFTDETFSRLFSRPVTADGGGPGGVVEQPFVLSITPSIDTLTVSTGPPTRVRLSGNRMLEIVPLGTTLSRTAFGTSLFDLTGTFTLTPTPEPATLMLSGIGALGLLMARRRKRDTSLGC